MEKPSCLKMMQVWPPCPTPRTQYEFDSAYNSFFYWLTDDVTMDFLDHKDVLDIVRIPDHPEH